MFFVVAYDISSPRRLARVARLMKNFGTRVQKSVFECDINETLFCEMKRKIEKVMDLSKDAVRYYFLCRKCRQRIDLSGTGFLTDKEDIIIV
jgi:CRISPR-associated protein Cas2